MNIYHNRERLYNSALLFSILVSPLSLSLCLLHPLLVSVFPLRHLQREMENQDAQANRFQQHMRRLDEDLKQNEGLLRRAHIEQKTTKVTILPITRQY